MKNRFSVGLTGGIGSGKSTVADLFAARGATVIDTDLIAHRLCAPDGAAIAVIRARFGAAFIAADGAMDRTAMRDKVFSDPAARQQLEAILHPLIRAETERAAQQARGDYLMPVVPLLVESGNWVNRVTRVLVIDCPEELQIRRVMQRNQISREQVLAIMASQVTRATRLAAANDVIANDADASALLPQVERLHALYLTLAAKFSQRL